MFIMCVLAEEQELPVDTYTYASESNSLYLGAMGCKHMLTVSVVILLFVDIYHRTTPTDVYNWT